MTRIAASIWVDGPPDTVFRVMEAPEHPLLPKGGPCLSVLDSGGVGARYRWEFKRLGLDFRLDSAVVVYRPGERIAFRSVAGWEMEAEATLWPEAGGTRLIVGMRYRFPVPLRWLVPGPLIRLGVWHALRQIKDMTEQGAGLGALPT